MHSLALILAFLSSLSVYFAFIALSRSHVSRWKSRRSTTQYSCTKNNNSIFLWSTFFVCCQSCAVHSRSLVCAVYLCTVSLLVAFQFDVFGGVYVPEQCEKSCFAVPLLPAFSTLFLYARSFSRFVCFVLSRSLCSTFFRFSDRSFRKKIFCVLFVFFIGWLIVSQCF